MEYNSDIVMSRLDFAHVIDDKDCKSLKDWLEFYGLDIRFCEPVSLPNIKNVYKLYYNFYGHIKAINAESFEDLLRSSNGMMFFLLFVYDFDHEKNIVTFKYSDWFNKTLRKGSIVGRWNYNCFSTSLRETCTPNVKNLSPICFFHFNEDEYQELVEKQKSSH